VLKIKNRAKIKRENDKCKFIQRLLTNIFNFVPLSWRLLALIGEMGLPEPFEGYVRYGPENP